MRHTLLIFSVVLFWNGISIFQVAANRKVWVERSKHSNTTFTPLHGNLSLDFKIPSRRGAVKLGPKTKGPFCKNGAKICEHVENYPLDIINDLIRNKIITAEHGFQDARPKLDSRRILGDEEIPACGYRPRLIFPTAAQAENQEWFFVVNTKEIRQGAVVEECLRPHKPCSMIGSRSMNTVCEQTYLHRRFLVLRKDDKYFSFQPGYALVKIPGCCMCKILPPAPRKRPGRRNLSPARKSIAPFVPDVSKCNKKFGICDNVPNYPYEHVKKLIREKKVPNVLPLFDTSSLTLSTRDFKDQGLRLCPSIKSVVAPQAILFKNSTGVYPNTGESPDWKFSFYPQQHEEGAYYRVQQVFPELCDPPEGPCKHTQNVPAGYVTTCRQKYMNIKQFILDRETGDPHQVDYSFPSCCVCIIKSVSSTRRLGIPDRNPMSPVRPKKKTKH